MKGKDILTTGEIAKICNVSYQTAIRWIDRGLLKGFRIPGSTHRRVVLHNLIEFLKNNKMSYDETALNKLVSLPQNTKAP